MGRGGEGGQSRQCACCICERGVAWRFLLWYKILKDGEAHCDCIGRLEVASVVLRAQTHEEMLCTYATAGDMLVLTV